MPVPVNPAIRLLSPERRRIYPNGRTGTRLPVQPEHEGNNITLMQRAGLNPGQPDDMTWDCLIMFGWVIYEGQAQTDEEGFIKTTPEGTAVGDPFITPNPWGTNKGGVK